jgi:murein DD-endopeptidase MepM/ murein hydrolase activator NlpD
VTVFGTISCHRLAQLMGDSASCSVRAMASAIASRSFATAIAGALALTLAACGTSYSPRVTTETTAATPAPPASGTYNVIAGDTIYVVARRFGVTVRSLIDANNLQPPFQLAPGQVLQIPNAGGYIVVKGDTLAKIARKTGVEFATLARMNGLTPPYVIRVGQRLMLPTGVTAQANGDTTVIESPNVAQGAQPGAVSAAPVEPMHVEVLPNPTPPPKETMTFGSAPAQGAAPQPAPVGGAGSSTDTGYKPLAQRDSASKPEVASVPTQPSAPAVTQQAALKPAPAAQPAPAQTVLAAPSAAPNPAPALAAVGPAPQFVWPVHGAVLVPFGSIAKGQHNDGINIAVPKDTPVVAAADGDVAYAGNELRGFGNLLLIKHAGGWVTAYAHNDKLLVRRGDHVRRGQKIALSGDSGGVGAPQLHFELRQGVKPIDPQTALPAELSPVSVPAGQQDPG